MSRCDWLRHTTIGRGLIGFVLLAVAFCYASAHGQEQRDPNPAAESQRTQPQQTAPNETRPPPALENPKPVVVPEQKQPELAGYQASCDKPKNREDADLCEQRRMAQAAEDSVWWARFQTLLGIFGFGAVLVSLIFTGWAAIAASRAAKAAEVSVGVASLTAQRQLRAYICTISSHVRNLGMHKVVQAHIVAKNAGQTPAYAVGGLIGIGLDEFPPKIPFELPKDMPMRKDVTGPNGEIHLTADLGAPSSKLQADALDAGKAAIYVIGEIRYRDAFGIEQHTRFKKYYGGDTKLNPNGVLYSWPDGNEAT